MHYPITRIQPREHKKGKRIKHGNWLVSVAIYKHFIKQFHEYDTVNADSIVSKVYAL